MDIGGSGIKGCPVDLETGEGSEIEIEERPPDEVLLIKGRSIAPPGTDARNPAFDVTPAELITAIVTDEGALRPPFGPSLAAAAERSRQRAAANAAARESASGESAARETSSASA